MKKPLLITYATPISGNKAFNWEVEQTVPATESAREVSVLLIRVWRWWQLRRLESYASSHPFDFHQQAMENHR